jgi:hypothetical protein
MCQPDILHFGPSASMCSRDYLNDPSIASLGPFDCGRGRFPVFFLHNNPFLFAAQHGHKFHQCGRWCWSLRDLRCGTKWLSIESAPGTSTIKKPRSLRSYAAVPGRIPRRYDDFTITGARSRPAASLFRIPLKSQPSPTCVSFSFLQESRCVQLTFMSNSRRLWTGSAPVLWKKCETCRWCLSSS